MARITVEDCLQQVGDGQRFGLIHLAVQRVKQHRQGEPYLVEGKNKEVVMSLREIAAGLVTPENIDELPSADLNVPVLPEHNKEVEAEL
ncbi:DNA-directed RNA polymerase subunit omega [Desulfofustis glycolicus]|uniref:DNA-directed RNA polymerase subunit omega n=1 Tax=Desulfofustis glycolicus DSM 9705 TaxID=1121409 RepID=A0A1M5X9B9_9BACT|nr:DNA-directed RNA polymerase subunit omega [Desulfofustis glycolicus]MCB2218120.1 DNA-directed RNA polymerase subunit omega [Desulfobulbaceae bacterium]SHH96124.1 DNA-directed RNA polymerase subunit omega [Desulfofustis glycolicus DSM 9705]